MSHHRGGLHVPGRLFLRGGARGVFVAVAVAVAVDVAVAEEPQPGCSGWPSGRSVVRDRLPSSITAHVPRTVSLIPAPRHPRGSSLEATSATATAGDRCDTPWQFARGEANSATAGDRCDTPWQFARTDGELGDVDGDVNGNGNGL
ncbi:MAG: hypothetical protein H6704_13365 [Myxococcales bacterium]|nr:hypothetical protein [Myxococcales bacterium]